MGEKAVGEKVKRGLQGMMIDFIKDTTGEVFTIGELQKVYPGWEKAQIQQVMSNLLNVNYTPIEKDPFGGRLKKLQTGVWKLEPNESKPQEALRLEHLTVTIIKEVDNEMIVVDENTNIYRMVKVA